MACQISMAAVIFFNFVAQCVQTQRLDAAGSLGAVFFDALEDVCTLIYCLELALNIFSTWFWEFVLNGWNYFDMLVIAASVYTVIANRSRYICIYLCMYIYISIYLYLYR